MLHHSKCEQNTYLSKFSRGFLNYKTQLWVIFYELSSRVVIFAFEPILQLVINVEIIL
jgi:hypothetical protein